MTDRASEWRTIESAPKDGQRILVFGQPDDLVIDGNTLTHWAKPGIHAAAWDEIDNAFCLDGGSWLGPFIEPTHWMSLPPPPGEKE